MGYVSGTARALAAVCGGEFNQTCYYVEQSFTGAFTMIVKTAPRFAALIAALALTALTLVGPAYASAPQTASTVASAVTH
jgi:hypothetical protein